MQRDTSDLDAIFTLEFQTIQSFNLRQKFSPCQFLKLTTSQTTPVEYTLCNQCHCFLSKDVKSDDFADKYPSFLWYLLVCNLSEYSGEDLWCMIPSTMHPWWFPSLTQPGQDWSHVYVHQISLSLPPPIFNDCTIGLTALLNDVETHKSGLLVNAMENETEFLPKILCPFDCSEYCHKGSYVAWDLVLQHLLLRVLLPHVDNNRYQSVKHMWGQYYRQ